MSQLFRITLETGDLSEFDSTTGNVSATTAAAMVGNYGLSAQIVVAAVAYGQKNFSISTNEFRCRIYIDPSALTMADGNIFDAFRVFLSNAPWTLFSISLFYGTATGYDLRVFYWNDSGANTRLNITLVTTKQHFIEVRIKRAATAVSNDGEVQAWVDGVEVGSVSNVDNFDAFSLINVLRTGAVTGIDAGTSGTLYLDDIIVRDDGNEIGPAVIIPVFMSNYRMRRANVS